MDKKIALLLLSQGIDSPVAGHMIKKQGIEIEAIHFDTGNSIDTIKELCAKTKIKKLYLIKYSKVLKQISKICKKDLTCVLCKRTMLKIVERLAQKKNISYLITGDNIAQVASQTVENMIAIRSNINMPILSPLLGFDKQEIIDIAKKIETYEISTQNVSKCSFVPLKPITKIRTEILEKEEKKLENEKIMKIALENCKECIINSTKKH